MERYGGIIISRIKQLWEETQRKKAMKIEKMKKKMKKQASKKRNIWWASASTWKRKIAWTDEESATNSIS